MYYTKSIIIGLLLLLLIVQITVVQIKVSVSVLKWTRHNDVPLIGHHAFMDVDKFASHDILP